MIQCPSCGYVRKPEDAERAPDYECPDCGIVYAKYKPKASSATPPQQLVKCRKCGMFRTPEYCPHCNQAESGKGMAAKNPKLGSCKVCGKEVSRTAKVCPHCGEAKPVKSGQMGCGSVVLFVVLALWLIGKFSPSPTEAPAPPAADPPKPVRSGCVEVVCNSAWDGSVSQVEEYLKATLKDPDSMKDVKWGKVTKTSIGDFRVWVQYRAKNSFGAYILAHQTFLLNAAGVIVDVDELK